MDTGPLTANAALWLIEMFFATGTLFFIFALMGVCCWLFSQGKAS